MTTYDEVRSSRLADLSPDERALFDSARADAELALDIAQMIYDARRSAGLTQKQLATAMGVSQSHVSALEGGGTVPSLPTLLRVARALGQHLRVEIAA